MSIVSIPVPMKERVTVKRSIYLKYKFLICISVHQLRLPRSRVFTSSTGGLELDSKVQCHTKDFKLVEMASCLGIQECRVCITTNSSVSE